MVNKERYVHRCQCLKQTITNVSVHKYYYFPVIHLNMICTVEFCVCSLLDLEGKRCDWILSNITLLLSSVPRRSKTKTIYRFKKKKIDVLGGNLLWNKENIRDGKNMPRTSQRYHTKITDEKLQQISNVRWRTIDISLFWI